MTKKHGRYCESSRGASTKGHLSQHNYRGSSQTFTLNQTIPCKHIQQSFFCRTNGDREPPARSLSGFARSAVSASLGFGPRQVAVHQKAGSAEAYIVASARRGALSSLPQYDSRTLLSCCVSRSIRTASTLCSLSISRIRTSTSCGSPKGGVCLSLF